MEVKELFDTVKKSLYNQAGQRDSLVKRLNDTTDSISNLEKSLELYSKASLFLQTLSDTTRKHVIDKISNIVTDALKKIKDKDLEFRMVLSTERNQTDLKFLVYNERTKAEYDILNSCGGSIADIVTFPLKFSLLVKWEPSLSRLIVLDENFKFVSVRDQEALGEFIRQISEKLDMQILLVTHSPTLTSKAHKIFEISQSKDESKVEVLPS